MSQQMGPNQQPYLVLNNQSVNPYQQQQQQQQQNMQQQPIPQQQQQQQQQNKIYVLNQPYTHIN